MRPRRHAAERGFALVDTALTITLVGVAVLVLVFSFAQAQKIAAISTRAAGLEAVMRQASDALRSPAGYTYCASTSSYVSQLPAAPSGDTITITAVVPVTGSASGGAPLPAVMDCTAGVVINNTCPAGHLCDYGMQRITVVVSDTGPPSSVTRSLFKGAH